MTHQSTGLDDSSVADRYACKQSAGDAFYCPATFECSPSCRVVTSDLGEPAQNRPVIQGGNHGMCPESGAVLTNPPPTVDGHPVAYRNGELTLRLSCRAVFRRIEDPEVTAHDFMTAITLELLSARIPRHHSPIGRQQEDRVLAHGG